jgi:phospholipid/cholesterol/gamma-HCH transport system permease protein
LIKLKFPYPELNGVRSAGPTKSEASYSLEVHQETFDELLVKVSGVISVDNADILRKEILEIIEDQPLRNLVIDLGNVEYFDSSGAAILAELYVKCTEKYNTFKVVNANQQIRSLIDKLELGQSGEFCQLYPKSGPGIIVQIGSGAEEVLETGRDIVIFIGAAVVALLQDLRNLRNVKWDPFWKIIERCGPDALPIVLILSFLMGAILAFQAAIQLRKFGANIFVADLVSVAICLEMGPLMTAIIVAGRSGAGFAAQLGTMQVTEEVDALRVMGIDPIRFLVSPRVLALAIAVPLLAVLADIVGTLGGCVVSTFALDLTPITYFNQVQRVLEVSDVLKGLIKSLTFGIEIALIGCLRGFQVRGGAESVGTATTSAVVTCVFVITCTDAIFAMLYHYVRFL